VIPFVDLKAQYTSIKDEVNTAIQGVLESCQFTLGSEVAAFETEFAAYCHTKHGIGVSTGTSALHLALLAANIGPGDEVITVPFTFVATVSAICYTGATPVFVDIDPRTFNMNANAIGAIWKTKAVSRCIYTGSRLTWIRSGDRQRHGLVVIEDACQAHGAEYRGVAPAASGI
jgi:dTDP-4-amino-4,6-dideoxygalactose transaminase